MLERISMKKLNVALIVVIGVLGLLLLRTDKLMNEDIHTLRDKAYYAGYRVTSVQKEGFCHYKLVYGRSLFDDYRETIDMGLIDWLTLD